MKIGPFTFASDFFTSKTTYTVLGGIGYLVAQGVHHEMPWHLVISGVIVALAGLFHNDTVRKGNEATDAHRNTVLGLALNQPAKINLDDVLKAHGASLKVAVANAVAATVTQVIAQLVHHQEAAEETDPEPRKPVQMAEEETPVGPDSCNANRIDRPTLTVVTGGTGVDAGSSAANAAHLMSGEPTDGEADV